MTKNKDPTLRPSGQKLKIHAYEKTSLLAPRCSAEATKNTAEILYI
jgi:hypothetical protein